MLYESVDPSVLVVIHPRCLTAIDVQSLRFEPSGTLGIEGFCHMCRRYVHLLVPRTPIVRDAPHEDAPIDQTVMTYHDDVLLAALERSRYDIKQACERLATERTRMYRMLQRRQIDIVALRNQERQDRQRDRPQPPATPLPQLRFGQSK